MMYPGDVLLFLLALGGVAGCILFAIYAARKRLAYWLFERSGAA